MSRVPLGRPVFPPERGERGWASDVQVELGADLGDIAHSFLTRSKTVFTYAEGGGTLMHATYQVEWTGKSMLKSRPGRAFSND